MKYFMKRRSVAWSTEFRCQIHNYRQIVMVYDSVYFGMYHNKWLYQPFRFDKMELTYPWGKEEGNITFLVKDYISKLDKFYE